jgi:hypothetical protein
VGLVKTYVFQQRLRLVIGPSTPEEICHWVTGTNAAEIDVEAQVFGRNGLQRCSALRRKLNLFRTRTRGQVGLTQSAAYNVFAQRAFGRVGGFEVPASLAS